MSMAMSGAKSDKRPVVAEATLRYHRGSAQKARLVLDQIRGRNVNDALGLLRFSPKVASGPIEKLLRSAVANAERAEEKVDVDTLYVAESYAGPGPTLKRFRGRAFGRAFRILHRSCHITVKLKAKGALSDVTAGMTETPGAGPAKGKPRGRTGAKTGVTATKPAPRKRTARKTAS